MTATINYAVLTNAISSAQLSRRAALQIELSVALIHFTQEPQGTDTVGKANLKAIYHAAGYECLTKADRDYKTVNRRLNIAAKLFDKLGSSLVNGWVENHGDTESVLQYVATELEVHQFHTLDDVQDFIGVESNRTRKPRQPVAAPVMTVAPAPEPEAEAETLEMTVEQYIAGVQAEVLSKLNTAEIRELCAALLIAVSERETQAEEAEHVELKAA